MTLKKDELELIENTDGLVVYDNKDKEVVAKSGKAGNGEASLEVAGERWVLCWVRMPGGGQ